MIIPIRSAVRPYNPWLDYDENGAVGLTDLVNLANSYGTTGDSTKNVTVANWPQAYSLQNGTMDITNAHQYATPLIYCGGYSRLSILWRADAASLGMGNDITIYLGSIRWRDFVGPYECASVEHPLSGCNITVPDGGYGFGGGISYMTETYAPYCYLNFLTVYNPSLPANWSVTIGYAVYLRNE
jgi:hypothetical protein